MTPRLARWLISDVVILLLIGAGVYIFGGAW